MVVVACVLSLAVSGLAKPFYGQFIRVPRSHLGIGYGGYSPCASAGGYHQAIPSYHAPSYGHIGYGHPHIGGYSGGGTGGYGGGGTGGYGGGIGGYGGPHYRADEIEDNASGEQETMSFSEMEPSENAPEARFVSLGGGYGAPAHAISAIAPASPGAVGVFPGAHVSGCNVPLLLSCSPSIVPGRIVSHSSYSSPAYGSSAAVSGISGAGAYRSDAESTHEMATSEKAEPAQHTTTVHNAATNISPAKTQ